MTYIRARVVPGFWLTFASWTFSHAGVLNRLVTLTPLKDASTCHGRVTVAVTCDCAANMQAPRGSGEKISVHGRTEGACRVQTLEALL